MTRYLCMNKLFTSKSIYLYTLPIILSELLEEVMILSDSILLSFKDPLYLSTVGIIDSIFLLFLAIGDSMNDSFQNYYSRHAGDAGHCLGIFTKSILLFAGIGALFALLCSLIPLFQSFFDGAHFETLVSVAPYLALLIFVSFISLSLNSLLMGWGYTKLLGCISLFSVTTNIALGYMMLYVIDTSLNPCSVVLVTSTIAELVAIVLMTYKVGLIYLSNRTVNRAMPHKSLVFETLAYASVYPSLSDMAFHLGSIALYSYCLCYFLDTETAIFTLFMSYWGVMQVPSQGFSETSINFFSNIYSKKVFSLYNIVKRRILMLSILTSIVFGIVILFIDVFLYEFTIYRLMLLILIMIIVGFNTFGEITETSLLVRLKNDSFMSAKVIYAVLLVLCITAFTLFDCIGVETIFISFLIAQILNCVYLRRKDNSIWRNKYDRFIL